MSTQNILTVSELNAYIKAMVESEPQLSAVYIRGEISNHKAHTSGHHYMTLKDEGGVLRAVMFKRDAVKLRFRPENGMTVLAHGRISVFERDGQYQLYIDDMIPDGVGALYVAFEQLKAKLAAEGLFDAAYKKPNPQYPLRIALVTSPTGAAVRDMLRILGKRFPLARIRIYPVRVQGTEAPAEICEGIDFINHHRLADVIITGRGGGSIEDLWAFNDEAVARTIFASEIPVISAVGHEPDVTIADFVADLRAPTPSGGAQLAVPDRMELLLRMRTTDAQLVAAVRHRLELGAQRLSALAAKRVLQSPENYIQDKRMLFEHVKSRLGAAADRVVAARRERFVRLTSSLDAMSPLRVLSRGYAVATGEQGNIVKSHRALSKDDQLHIRFAEGGALCRVLATHGDEEMKGADENGNGKNEL